MSDDLFKVVRFYDADLVAHVPEKALLEYMDRRDFDELEKHIPPEAQPMVFTCRQLTRSMRRLVRRQPSEADQNDLAFRLGVMQISNMPDGPAVVVPRRVREESGLTDDAMDELGLGDDDEQEIGAVIRRKAFLARGARLSCPLLDSSALAYGVAVQSLAEQKMASSTPTDEPSD